MRGAAARLDRLSVLIAGFPAGPWGTNCYVVATGPGTECVVVDPGKDAADGRRRGRPRAPAQAGRGPGHPRARRPHVVRGPGRRAPTTPRRGSTPTTGTCSPTRWPACRRRPAAMLLGGKYEFAEPDDVARAGRRPDARARRPRASSSTTPPATPRARSPSARRTTSRSPTCREVMFSGDLLFAGLDRPHRPARRRPPDDAAQPAPTRCCRCADDIVVLPGHGEQTSIGRERATNPFLLDLQDCRRPHGPAPGDCEGR